MEKTRARWRKGIVVGAASILAFGLAGCNTQYGATLDRANDPVVLTGAALPKLIGTAPSHIVGFSWDGSVWHQVPVQVDERDLVSPGAIYNLNPSAYPKLYGTTTPYMISVYTPPAAPRADYESMDTYTPPDSNPDFDSNDEVSYLAASTGLRASQSVGAPTGVIASSWQEIKATDPLDPSRYGYVYLFKSNTLTSGNGGTTQMSNAFSLDSGTYKATYKMSNGSQSPNNMWGFNPESTQIHAPGYTQSYGDRWLNNGLQFAGSSTQVLDRSKYFATSQLCPRTEDTFDGADQGEGAFVVNITGSVRAIRSYMGANSFKWTTVTETFYPTEEVTTIELRGHAGMPGFGQSDDLATGLTGMTYSDPANSNLTIDGVPDAFTPITSKAGDASQPSRWQMIKGSHGALITVRTLETSIADLDLSTTYRDDQSPTTPPCTGDGSYWGENGYTTTSPTNNVPATDPTLTATPESYTAHRFRYFEASTADATTGALREQWAKYPITTTVTG